MALDDDHPKPERGKLARDGGPDDAGADDDDVRSCSGHFAFRGERGSMAPASLPHLEGDTNAAVRGGRRPTGAGHRTDFEASPAGTGTRENPCRQSRIRLWP